MTDIRLYVKFNYICMHEIKTHTSIYVVYDICIYGKISKMIYRRDDTDLFKLIDTCICKLELTIAEIMLPT